MPFKRVAVDVAAALRVREIAIRDARHRVLAHNDGDVVSSVDGVADGLRGQRLSVHQLRLWVQVLKPDATRTVHVQHQDLLCPGLHQAVDGGIDLRGQQALGRLIVLTGGIRVLLKRHNPGNAFQIGHHQDFHCIASPFKR